MKKLLIFLALAPAILLAWDSLVEADYPLRFEVINTSRIGAFMIGTFCTMGIRDPTTPGVVFVLQKHQGSCHVWDAGTVLHAQRSKDKMKLLVQDEKGKTVVENWSITASVAVK